MAIIRYAYGYGRNGQQRIEEVSQEEDARRSRRRRGRRSNEQKEPTPAVQIKPIIKPIDPEVVDLRETSIPPLTTTQQLVQQETSRFDRTVLEQERQKRIFDSFIDRDLKQSKERFGSVAGTILAAPTALILAAPTALGRYATKSIYSAGSEVVGFGQRIFIDPKKQITERPIESAFAVVNIALPVSGAVRSFIRQPIKQSVVAVSRGELVEGVVLTQTRGQRGKEIFNVVEQKLGGSGNVFKQTFTKDFFKSTKLGVIDDIDVVSTVSSRPSQSIGLFKDIFKQQSGGVTFKGTIGSEATAISTPKGVKNILSKSVTGTAQLDDLTLFRGAGTSRGQSVPFKGIIKDLGNQPQGGLFRQTGQSLTKPSSGQQITQVKSQLTKVLQKRTPKAPTIKSTTSIVVPSSVSTGSFSQLTDSQVNVLSKPSIEPIPTEVLSKPIVIPVPPQTKLKPLISSSKPSQSFVPLSTIPALVPPIQIPEPKIIPVETPVITETGIIGKLLPSVGLGKLTFPIGTPQGFFPSGGGFSLKTKGRRSKQPKKVVSTAFAAGFGLTGKITKGGITSGLGIRPLKAKKKTVKKKTRRKKK